MWVKASDGGTPARTATAAVLVTVDRNLKDPKWERNYTAEILETQGLGVEFKRVQARDEDQQEPWKNVFYRVTGRGPAEEYFGVNPNGGVFVKKSLQADERKTEIYNVSTFEILYCGHQIGKFEYTKPKFCFCLQIGRCFTLTFALPLQ